MAKARKRSRGLSGTPSEHLQHAAYRLRAYTKARIDRLPCSEVPMAIFDMGAIMAHATEADEGSFATGQKLYTMASKRRDQLFAKASACGVRKR
jgi:hypothetical protein